MPPRTEKEVRAASLLNYTPEAAGGQGLRQEGACPTSSEAGGESYIPLGHLPFEVITTGNTITALPFGRGFLCLLSESSLS